MSQFALDARPPMNTAKNVIISRCVINSKEKKEKAGGKQITPFIPGFHSSFARLQDLHALEKHWQNSALVCGLIRCSTTRCAVGYHLNPCWVKISHQVHKNATEHH